MKIDVLGCGSAFSLQQNTSAIRIIDAENRQWLIDCGPTIPRALWQRGLDVNDIDAIYFSHVHPDHCTGLTALAQACALYPGLFLSQDGRFFDLRKSEIAPNHA